MKNNVHRKFVLKRDNPDHKKIIGEHVFELSRAPLPTMVDLRPGCPPVYDQSTLGSCTANAIGAAYQYDQIRRKTKSNFAPSRLFVYYNERKMEGTVEEDCGASISDGVMSIHTTGVVPEDMWPYDVDKFAVEPDESIYQEAKKHLTTKFKSILQSAIQIKTCLSQKHPIILGITLFESFQSDEVAKTGLVPMPKKSENTLGGHAVLCVGYDDHKKHFIMRNSWGSGWGDQGYFYLPYDYMLDSDLACDFWAILDISDRSLPLAAAIAETVANQALAEAKTAIAEAEVAVTIANTFAEAANSN